MEESLESEWSDPLNESDSGPHSGPRSSILPTPSSSINLIDLDPPTLEHPAQSYSDHYPPRPYNPNTTRYSDMGSPNSTLNLDEEQTSSTVQGGNMTGVAVAEYDPMDADQNSFNNAALVARETIVIDEDDASSSKPPIQLYQISMADNDYDRENAGVLAVAAMQVRLASVGCAGAVRKQDKRILGELADNISTRDHLPESFTLLPEPENRRPVLTPVEERIESTVMHTNHSWTDMMKNIVSAGDGMAQVSAEFLLQQLGDSDTLKFIRAHKAVIRISNEANNAQLGNVMVTHSVSKHLSFSKNEHKDYISRTPMIFKFLNTDKANGITFSYQGVDWIQGDAVMADTGCDIMLITKSMAKGMNLPI